MAEKALRIYAGTLKNLALPDWELTDGKDAVLVSALINPPGARHE